MPETVELHDFGPNGRLTPAEREVWDICRKGADPEEAALQTGRAASTARTLLMRARRKKGIKVTEGR